VRNVGGTLDGISLHIEGLGPLEAGEAYMLALIHVESPLDGGFETALSFVGLDQGILRSTEAGFVNSLGVTIAEPNE
jgi:hypothetical protein